MDKITAIDLLIINAKTAALSEAGNMDDVRDLDAQILAENRERVLDSIQAWCDCGKGDMCPQYGKGFNA